MVGASLAGVRAVEAARKAGFRGKVTLVGDERHAPYDRPPLSKALLQPGTTVEAPVLRSEASLRDDLDVCVRLGIRATGLDSRARVLGVGTQEIAYDALVVATGAAAHQIPGSEHLAGVHTLRTLDDARAVRAGLDDHARTVVVGAGFIGSEVASAARKRGLNVTIVETQPTPLVRAVGRELGAACSLLHVRNGTDLRCGVAVAAIEGDARVERVRLTDGTTIEADLVVIGIGASPCTGWLSGSGLELEDGVLCDDTLRSSVASVYAAGDVARWHNPLFSSRMRIEHWTSAAEQGAHAARNAIGHTPAEPYSTVPYFWSDWYGSRIQFVGVASGDAYEVVSGDLNSDHFVALYRRGDKLGGTLTLNGQRHIMKYRRLLAEGASFAEALDFGKTMAREHTGTARRVPTVADPVENAS
ncbi:NAD(P)/FAD-dependent oxidoreductase [Nocardia vaccinii]|uniref:NAD(P)/FAD-dependent oxidoreductase n=1 Tax=Nocardia vaccinii TaxID=1822 RepID=UPI0027D77FAF|nr:FAD-dependent oxidoreductase [Nocardia vaccinii]